MKNTDPAPGRPPDELADLRRQFTALAGEQNRTAILFTDTEGTIQHWMAKAEQTLGYTAAEATGKPFHFFYRPENRDETVIRIIDKIQEIDAFFGEIPCLNKEGTPLLTKTTLKKIYDENHRPVGLIGIHKDITRSRQLIRSVGAHHRMLKTHLDQRAAALDSPSETSQAGAAGSEQTRPILSTLISNLPGMVYRCRNDREWTMEFVSDGCRDLTGYKPADLIGNRTVSFGQLIHPEDRRTVWSAIQTALNDGRPFQLTYRITTAGGEQKWVWEQGRGIALPGENRRFIEGFITDITDSKRMEERARQQDRLAAVGQLAAGIAHDFNNILTVTMGSAQLLELSPDIPESAKEDLRQISSQGQRAAQLIRQILDFSRQTVVERRPLDLVPFLKETLKMLQRLLPESIRLVAEFNARELIVSASPTQLQQVITNLAINARDAMPGGGTLRISLGQLRIEPEDAPPLPELAPGDWIEWSVSDTGTGIPPEVIPHIFEPFYTTKQQGQGTGLGLAQVYGIVTQHNGFITVESPPDGGATFRTYLPQIAGQDASLQAENTHIPIGNGQTILVVEDEHKVLEILQAMLKSLNYRVRTASSGREALELYGRYANEIALVLTDLVMPDMGGIELFEALKQKTPDVRVTIMTGYAVGGEGTTRLPDGISGYVEKPLILEQVAKVVQEALDE